jgi:hypothetical protein
MFVFYVSFEKHFLFVSHSLSCSYDVVSFTLSSSVIHSVCFALSFICLGVCVSSASEKFSLCVYVSAPGKKAGISRYEALAEAFG